MQNAVWKLTALAGVVGIGFLMVLQAQRGLTTPEQGGDPAAEVSENSGNLPQESDLGFEEGMSFGQNQTGDDSNNLQPEPGLLPPEQTQAAGHIDSGFDASNSQNPNGSPGQVERSADWTTKNDAPAGPGLDFRDARADAAGPNAPSVDEDPFRFADETETPSDNLQADPTTDPQTFDVADQSKISAKPAASKPQEFPQPADEADGGFGSEESEPALLDVSGFGGNDSAPPSQFEDNPTQPNDPSKANTVGSAPKFAGSQGSETPQATGNEPKPAMLPRELPSAEEGPGTSPLDVAEGPELANNDSPASSDNLLPFGRRDSPLSNESSKSLTPAPEAFGAPDLEPELSANGASQPGNQRTAPELPQPGAEFSEKRLPQIENLLGNEASPSPENKRPANNGLQRTPETPQPLNPNPGASQFANIDESDLQGRGVLRENVPTGPQRPQLVIQKVAPANALIGQPLVYNIVVRNIGTSPAAQVVVEDEIPKGSKLSGTIPRAELANQRLVWKLGTLQPGQEKKIAIRVVPLSEGQLGSVATVNFVAEIAAKTRVTAPKLRLQMNAPKQGKLGDPVLFHFKISNDGTGDARGVTIRNLIPAGFRHPGGNDLEYEVGTVAGGKSVEINLTLTAAQLGTAVNRAMVTADGGVSLEAKAAVEIIGTHLVVKRTGPKRRFLGRAARFTNTVTNKSGQPIQGVTVLETVPEGMEFVEATEGGQYIPGDRTIAWKIGPLGAGQSRNLQVTLAAKGLGMHQSVVTAIDDAQGRRTQVTTETSVEGFASLAIDIPPLEGPLEIGEQVTVRMTARNRGSAPATNVKIRFTIPPEMQLVSVRGPAKYTQVGQQILFAPLPAIDGATQAAFDVVLKARQAAETRLQVQIEADQMKRPLGREEAILILNDDQ